MSKEERTDSYSHILKYTGLFGGVQGLGILVGIIRNKLVAVLLGPQGMGLVSLFNSTIKLVGDSTNFGLSMSAVKRISEDFDSGDEERVSHAVDIVRYWSFVTALLGTILCVALSPLLSRLTFSWNGHTFHFICLAPVVGLTAITGGELAILKGVRQLRHLAAISVYNMLAALFISVPIYYFFGSKGIVPSLVLMALAQTILTIACSYKLYPLRLKFGRGLFADGISMIKLGTAFVVAGLFGSGADFVIRSYINNVAGIETVGLYNAAFMMTMTYVGMVFSAMETDYFPRLSGVSHFGVTFTTTVNRQIEVMVLLAAPLLVAFMVGLPVLLPLLYSGRFLPAIGMMQVVVFAMYFRVLKLPIEYIPLAKGDSKSYMFLEVVDDVAIVLLVVAFFHEGGLAGAGFGILAAAFFDFILVVGYAKWKYKFVLSRSVVSYALVQLPIGFLALLATQIRDRGFVYWGVGVVLFVVSSAASIIILHSKSNLWRALEKKLFRRK